ncbi:tyrosine-type recombinase/integrase [Christensenellaceae bacterium OttesenSCG-928-K19]|nr:tyrosine-type recombinase/integrase [Christensenellaceae bacterium OttesenSCG-928-K19]
MEIGEAHTKTDKSRRTLPLEQPLKGILLRRREEIAENRRMYGNCYSYSNEHLEFVCVDDFGKRIKLNYVSCAYSKILEKLGLRKIRFHNLRHTSASMLIKAGQNLTDVMNWLGHSSFKITQRYSHLEALSKKGIIHGNAQPAI